MSFNTFGHVFRFTTWGESHGPALGAVVDGSTVTKLLVWDVLPDVSTAIGGLALEKIEGIAVLNGDIWINTDNDGLSDSSGESRLIKLGKVPK